uniref:MKS transition zone complex subunit 1 n=1 Tax=Poecilia latipinna TaxID=48699 RepID=A0A3B3VRU7_9TELE
MVSATKSSPTFLAERMASVRNRRQERRTMDSSITKSRIINWDPTDEFVKSSHVVNNAMQTMHIMDLGNMWKEAHEYFCKAKVMLVLFCRIVTNGEKREVWRLTLENASRVMKPEEREREQIMYKDLYNRHKEYLNSLVGQDFEMVKDILSEQTLVLLIEQFRPYVSANDFEYDNLYINFFMELPNNWSSLPFQSMSGVTQTCRTKSLGKVSFFSYPFSFEAFYMSEKENEGQYCLGFPSVLTSLRFLIGYLSHSAGCILVPSQCKPHRLR